MSRFTSYTLLGSGIAALTPIFVILAFSKIMPLNTMLLSSAALLAFVGGVSLIATSKIRKRFHQILDDRPDYVNLLMNGHDEDVLEQLHEDSSSEPTMFALGFCSVMALVSFIGAAVMLTIYVAVNFL